LLWASVVIGFVAGIVNLVATDRPVTNYRGGSVHDIALLISWSIALLIIWWILSSIRKGKNWARIVQVVFFVLGILSVLMVLVMPQRISGIVWMVYAVQMSLNVWGMILLFSTPANAWFRDMKEWRGS
jgi:hypothetical protein